MLKLLERRGYQDWAGEVDGYGSNLEIRVFATLPKDLNSIPDDRLRVSAPVHLNPPRPQPQPLEKDPRVQAMLDFAAAVKR